jgi:hypothetical protein
MITNRKLNFFAAILISLLSITGIARAQGQVQTQTQTPVPASPSSSSRSEMPWDKSIEYQFNYVIEKSSKYEDYRVIKNPWVYTLRNHVLDTLKGVRKQLRETETLVLTKEKTIDTLKSALSSIDNNLTTVTKEKNSVRFLGIQMAKFYYNSLMWSIIIGLFTLLLIFIMLFRRSNVVTTQTKIALAEAKEEFETHRKRSREREERLARQYLDELNKYKSQTKKG